MREGILLGITFWPVLSATIAATVIGLKSGIFQQEAMISIVMMTVVSTLLTPFVLRFAVGSDHDRVRMKDHVVIIGCGRTSSSLISALKQKDRNFVVIDSNMGKIDRLERRGIKAIYGNATDSDVLSSASIGKARTVLITVTEGSDAYTAAKIVRNLNRGCFIIVQVHTQSDRSVLSRENLADMVLWPEKLSAKIAMDFVMGTGSSVSWLEPAAPVVSPPSPRPVGLSRGKRKVAHGTHMSDVPHAP